MNIIKWAAGAGQGLIGGAAFGAEIDSLASGGFALSSVVVTNGTALDLYADLSLILSGTTPASGQANLVLYLFALLHDGTTYGDGTGSGATAPVQLAERIVPVRLGVSSGALSGIARGIVLPPGSFKFGLLNSTGNALAASGNAIQYRTYDETGNG